MNMALQKHGFPEYGIIKIRFLMTRDYFSKVQSFIGMIAEMYRDFRESMHLVGGKKTLFSESFLGLDRFKSRKDQESTSSRFKEKFENLFVNPKLRVYGHDFKRFVYLVNTEEDFNIFSSLLERYGKASKGSREDVKFEIFNIGPEIMRVYYTMNKPVEALKLLQDPDIFSLTCNLPSLLILQDLLYENGMYQEVCDVFNIVKEKQFFRKIFHFGPYTLFQAACYKMDTPDSYENVLAWYERYLKHNKRPDWLVLLYTLIFTLKNSSYEIPIKHAVGGNPACVNIRLSALIKSGNYSDALSYCDSLKSKSIIMKSVAEDLCKPLESDGTVEDEFLMRKLQKFKEDIGQENLLDKTLDELAANVISALNKTKEY